METTSGKRPLDDEVPPLPEGWTEKISKSRGVPYYVNRYTQETTWDRPTTQANKPEEEEAGARHILRKHRGSRRPSSWRCEVITQSKEEAVREVEAYRARLKKTLEEEGYEAMEALFISIAKTDSDCGSAAKGGDLGSFGRGKMQKSFEDATFGLAQGELSGICDSDSGIHIILRYQ